MEYYSQNTSDIWDEVNSRGLRTSVPPMTIKVIRVSDLSDSDTLMISAYSDSGYTQGIVIGDNGEGEVTLSYSAYDDDYDLVEPYNVRYKWLSVRAVLVNRG